MYTLKYLMPDGSILVWSASPVGPDGWRTPEALKEVEGMPIAFPDVDTIADYVGQQWGIDAENLLIQPVER